MAHQQQQGGGGGQAPPPPQQVYPITYQAMRQHKDHPLRMKLESDEIYRAQEIKEAIRRTPGLDNISDFWCAQYSFLCKDDTGNVLMEDVIARAEALQVFRNQYHIEGSYEEGRRALRRFATLCPNYTLSFMHNPHKGNYAVVRNLANIDARNFSDADERDFMEGYYYSYVCCCPDFQSIYTGPDFVVECKDMGWSKSHNMKLLHKAAVEFLSFFPLDVSSAELYNTGVAGSVFQSLLKPLLQILTEPLGEQWHSHRKIHFGLTYLEGLDSLFLVPDAATAQENVLQEMEASLRLRFDNERRFSLSDDSWRDISPFTDDEVEALDEARRR